MKNSIPSRHNRAKGASSQAETAAAEQLNRPGQPGAALSAYQQRCRQSPGDKGQFVLPPNPLHLSCLAIFDREAGAAVTKIPLSDEEFCQLSERALQMHMDTAHFVAAAVRDRLNRPADDGLCDLETACLRVDSLVGLLVDKLDQLTKGETEFSGDHAEHYVAGVSLLAGDTLKILRSAFDKTWTAHRTTA